MPRCPPGSLRSVQLPLDRLKREIELCVIGVAMIGKAMCLYDGTQKCAQNNVTLLFFPDFSPATAIRRKAFGPVLKKMTAFGLQPFLIYPAVIKLRHKGEQRSFASLQKAEDFVSSLSQRRTHAAALRGDDGGAAAAVSQARREGLDGRAGHGPSSPGGDDGRMNMDAC